MNFKKILISLSLATVLFLPVANVSAAIIDDTIINAANCSKENPCTLNTFLALGVSIAKYILGIVGALTLLMFVFGGLVWILSGGSSDKVQKGKDIILGSVVGLVIVFSSYLIVSFVSKELLGGAFTGKAPDDTLVAKTTNTADVCSQKGGTCKNICSSGDQDIDDGGYCKKKSQVCCKLIDIQGDCKGECIIKYATEPQCTLAEGSCNGGVATCCQPGSVFACNGSCLTRLECSQDKCMAQNLGYCAGDGQYCCSGGCSDEDN